MKLATILLSAALLMPGVAQSADRFEANGRGWMLARPHISWFSKPAPRDIKVYMTKASVMDDVCGDPHGCAFTSPASCIIYINRELSAEAIHLLQIHELAHCHGWGQDHSEEPAK